MILPKTINYGFNFGVLLNYRVDNNWALNILFEQLFTVNSLNYYKSSLNPSEPPLNGKLSDKTSIISLGILYKINKNEKEK